MPFVTRPAEHLAQAGNPERKRVFFPHAQAEHTDLPLFSHAARVVLPVLNPAAQRSFVAVRPSFFTAVIRRRGLNETMTALRTPVLRSPGRRG